MIGAPWVELLFVHPTAEGWLELQLLCFQCNSAKPLGELQKMAQVLRPLLPGVEDQDGVPGSWFRPGPNLAVAAIWET